MQNNPISTRQFDGVLRCSRYAFGPNRLHYCGPDANREIFSYIKEGASDLGLRTLLKAFKTLYPYLRHIAKANGIKDPFDNRVTEAYWIGNELLEHITKKKFYHHLLEDHLLKQRLGRKSFDHVVDKIQKGALPHHSFHVLDIWKRTGHLEREHTLESMDACRISWGMVKKIEGPFLAIAIKPLIFIDGKLALGSFIQKRITRSLDAPPDIEQVKIGDIISMHWGVPCEIISRKQAAMLEKYTRHHLKLANETI